MVGTGIEPHAELAEAAGLEVGDGIEVDEYARTSQPDIWAAGDVAEFPYLALGEHARSSTGTTPAATAAPRAPTWRERTCRTRTCRCSTPTCSTSARRRWATSTPRLPTHAVWREPYREGVVFYLRDDVVRGVLLWNVWDKVDWARELIRERRSSPTRCARRRWRS